MDVPVAPAQVVQAELVSDLSCVHGVWQILLVGEHQQAGVAQLVLQKTSKHVMVEILR